MSFIAAGTISPPNRKPMAERLNHLFNKLSDVFDKYNLDSASVEKTFVNCNPRDALTLGQARGIVMMTPACFNLEVHEYATNKVKKTVTGAGHANKEQIQFMIKRLLPTAVIDSADAADALAVAVCHASHYRFTQVA